MSEPDTLVWISARGTAATKRRIKVLAAKQDKTMRLVADEAFRRGLDIMEEEQAKAELDAQDQEEE
jgi:hypothetical protein